jgi:hypothetical protein
MLEDAVRMTFRTRVRLKAVKRRAVRWDGKKSRDDLYLLTVSDPHGFKSFTIHVPERFVFSTMQSVNVFEYINRALSRDRPYLD